MSYYLNDNTHMLITGATGAGDNFGGKTVTANWLCERSHSQNMVDMAVFFNPKGHSFVRGTTVRTLADLVETYRSGDRLFNYIPKTDTSAEHSQLIRTLRKVPGEKLVIHDEAHEVADSKMLDWCFRQGGNVGRDRYETGNIRSIAVTQHPWDLPESVSQNCPLMVWVGPTTPQTKRYFSTMQMPGAYEEIPGDSEPYCWSVIDAGEYIETNAPVPEEYA